MDQLQRLDDTKNSRSEKLSSNHLRLGTNAHYKTRNTACSANLYRACGFAIAAVWQLTFVRKCLRNAVPYHVDTARTVRPGICLDDSFFTVPHPVSILGNDERLSVPSNQPRCNVAFSASQAPCASATEKTVIWVQIHRIVYAVSLAHAPSKSQAMVSESEPVSPTPHCLN